MLRGEEEMDSHLDRIWSFYFNSSFCNSFGMEYGISSSSSFSFFKKITSYSFADKTLDFLEFWVARPFWDEWAHYGESGFCGCRGICLVEVDADTRSR